MSNYGLMGQYYGDGLLRVEPEAEPQWDRDMLLPFARRSKPAAQQPPQQWGSTADVMRTLDARQGNGWQFAVPSLLKDAYDAAAAVGGSAGGRPFVPSEQPELTENMIGQAGAIVGPMAAHGFARNALAPAGGAELGVFGRVGDRVARSPERAAAVLDRAAGMDRYNPGFSLRGLIDRQMATPRRIDSEPFDLKNATEISRTVTDVPINDIRTVQPAVSLSEVKNKLANSSSDDGKPPSVFKWGDQYFVNDGNHRIVAARARGLGTIPAEVIELGPKGATPPKAAATQSSGPLDAAPQPMGSAPADQGVGIRAYHGSPHDFDRFSLDKIGTGEGAQAYGHGLYFAENEGVAKSYRQTLSRADGGIDQIAQTLVDQAGGDWNKARQKFESEALARAQSLRNAGLKYELPPYDVATLQALRKGEPGRMYEVRINADPEHFLDWDKPLSQQSEKVRDAFEKAVPDRYKGITADEEVLAGEHYRDIFHENDNRVYRTMFRRLMNDEGVPGIRYLDQGSRGAGEGSRNYVVFDDALVQIVRKYMAAGMSMGAAVAAAQSQIGNQPGAGPLMGQPDQSRDLMQ